VDHYSIRVVCCHCGLQWRGIAVHQAAGEVVLDDEGSCGSGDLNHLAAPLWRQDCRSGVVEERLADEDPRPRGLEGVGQQVCADAVGVYRHRDWAQAGRASYGEHAGVGGRLNEYWRARHGQCSQRGGQRTLGSTGDQYVGGVE
jgi:hypothetical protein